MDYESFLQGGCFTFLVGKDKKHFNLHSKLVTHHSDVLGKMMNNKQMEESLTSTATLPDIEAATFLRFAQYMYLNYYSSGPSSVCSTLVKEPELSSTFPSLRNNFMVKFNNKAYFKCRSCNTRVDLTVEHEIFPFCSDSCLSNSLGDEPVYCMGCGYGIATDRALCDTCTPKLSIAAKKTEQASSKKWKDFEKRRYRVGGLTHTQIKSNLKNMLPADTITDDLMVHAKLWVFAERYNVQPLKELCLHKLHRDLCAYQVKLKSAPAIIALAEYTYDNTLGNETECKLRDLVMAYTLCQTKNLVETKEFRVMMHAGGELAGDFAVGAFNC